MYLANNHHVVIHEFVIRNLQVKRSRSFPDTASGVVMGTVTGAIIATKFTSIGNGHTSQVSTNSQDNEPFAILDAVSIRLGISEGSDIDGFLSLDFGGRPKKLCINNEFFFPNIKEFTCV